MKKKNMHTVYCGDKEFKKFQKTSKIEGLTQARLFRDYQEAYEREQAALKQKAV